MNSYLRIARQNKPETDTARRVEVLIIKDGKLCMSHFKDADGNRLYGFPGGHVDAGEKPIESAKRECLEEVGILIKNLSNLNIKAYDVKTATVTMFFSADFDDNDMSKYNTEADGSSYEWMTYSEAAKAIQDNNYVNAEIERGRAIARLPAPLTSAPVYNNW